MKLLSVAQHWSNAAGVVMQNNGLVCDALDWADI
jgi:hypothetical protein